MANIYTRIVLDIHVHESLIYIVFIWIWDMPCWLGYRSNMLLYSESSTSFIGLNKNKVRVKLQPECIETISFQREKVGRKVIFEQIYRRGKVINKEKYIKGAFFSK